MNVWKNLLVKNNQGLVFSLWENYKFISLINVKTTSVFLFLSLFKAFKYTGIHTHTHTHRNQQGENTFARR